MVKPEFTKEETELIRDCVYQVWNEVADDLLTGVAEEQGKSVEQVTVSRALAIEVSLDASRPEQNIKYATKSWEDAARADLLKRWAALSYQQKIAFVKPVFPYQRWGM